MNPDELAPNARVYSYGAARPTGAPADGDPRLIDVLTAHIERHIGPVADVWHEQASEYVHVDMHHVAPAAAPSALRWTTCTCCSARATAA